MRTVKKIIKTSIYERRDWKTEMYRFLRNYRATPHSTTGFPPATILFARSMKVKLPELNTEQSSQSPLPRDKVQRRDYHQNEKMKRYADNKAYVKPSTLKEGDNVLVRSRFRRKTDPVYDERPYRVTARKGSMVTARSQRYAKLFVFQAYHSRATNTRLRH